MKLRILVLLILLASVSLTFAQSETNEASFAIYLTKLSTAEMEQLRSTPMPLDSIPLEDKPVINEKDLVEYDFGKHIMKLTPEGFEKITKIQAVSANCGRPFVVVTKGGRRYMGVFWSTFSSASPTFPNIPTPVFPDDQYGTNCIPIRPPSFDVRYSVYMDLHKLGLLKKQNENGEPALPVRNEDEN